MSTLKSRLLALRPAMAKAAQAVLDGWEQDEEGFCEEYGGGGACDDVSSAIANVIATLPGVEITDGGQEGDDHAYVIAYDDQEAWAVDIPPSVYETGGGYSWKKREGARIDADDIVLDRVNRRDLDDREENPTRSQGEKRFWTIAEETRQAFERAGFEHVRKTHIEVDESIDTWAKGGRTVASCALDGKTIWVSPRIFTFDSQRQRALIAHELGHAVQGFYGDVVRGTDRTEHDADLLAERVIGKPLYYAPVDGRLIQTFCSLRGVRPRPKGLR